MAKVARIILVSKELTYADLAAFAGDMPNKDSWLWYVTWEYDDTSHDEKWRRYEMSTVSLHDIIHRGEDEINGLD